MVQSAVVVFIFVALFAFNFVDCEGKQLNANIQIVQNLTDYLQANPNVKILQTLQRDTLVRDTRSSIRYTLGNRISGKRINCFRGLIHFTRFFFEFSYFAWSKFR